MTDGPDNLILQYLRRIDAKVDRLADDVHDIKVRLTAVEEGLVVVNKQKGLAGCLAHVLVQGCVDSHGRGRMIVQLGLRNK